MNAVVYHSCTGQSKAVAKQIALNLGFLLYDLTVCTEREYENLVLVFPVHCQAIPAPVCAFLKNARIKNLSAVATYGGISHGNVLYEIQKKYYPHIVAAAYIPACHSYLGEPVHAAPEIPEKLISRIREQSEITVPRSPKNPLAALFPALRSRIGVKMIRTQACDGCGACEKVCPNGAISKGVTNRRCVRCLKCVKNCPAKALEFRLRFPMRLYLKKKSTADTEVF